VSIRGMRTLPILTSEKVSPVRRSIDSDENPFHDVCLQYLHFGFPQDMWLVSRIVGKDRDNGKWVRSALEGTRRVGQFARVNLQAHLMASTAAARCGRHGRGRGMQNIILHR
jgi:hypothetical protein